MNVKNQVFKNENILEGLLFSPDAPLEQAYLHTNFALVGLLVSGFHDRMRDCMRDCMQY